MMTQQYTCSYCVYNVVRPNSLPYNTDTFHGDNNIVIVYTTSSVTIVVLKTLTPSMMTKQYTCSYSVYNVVRPNSLPYNTGIFHAEKTM
jgi:hypothetical protein